MDKTFFKLSDDSGPLRLIMGAGAEVRPMIAKATAQMATETLRVEKQRVEQQLCDILNKFMTDTGLAINQVVFEHQPGKANERMTIKMERCTIFVSF